MQNYKLKLALIGYGKMGKVIEKLAKERGHKIIMKINSRNQDDFTASNLEEVDVAIEFSTPETVTENLEKLAASGTKTVCGTTGWLQAYERITKSYQDQGSAFLYASNFSLGVNVFFNLNVHLAKMMGALKNYDVNIHESHHKSKKDAPSGTAITLANQIIAHIEHKESWTIDDDSSQKEIHIASTREGDVKGLHEISYSSPIDEISIRHSAFSRDGFALGAIIAAEYLADKTGIHTMEKVLNLHTDK